MTRTLRLAQARTMVLSEATNVTGLSRQKLEEIYRQARDSASTLSQQVSRLRFGFKELKERLAKAKKQVEWQEKKITELEEKLDAERKKNARLEEQALHCPSEAHHFARIRLAEEQDA